MGREKSVRLVVIAALCCSLFAAPVQSQSGAIAPYGDESLIDCHVYDLTPGLVYVYIALHQWSGSSLGTRFSVQVPWSLTYFGEDSPYVKLGDALNGVTVCYESCLPSSPTPVLVLRLMFFGQGLTPPCTYFSVEPHPADSVAQSLDCDGNTFRPTTGIAIVNPDSGCLCQVANAGLGGQDEPGDGSAASTAHFCAWVPVEQNTWGAIKSLYR
jgi:hypothetical protein